MTCTGYSRGERIGRLIEIVVRCGTREVGDEDARELRGALTIERAGPAMSPRMLVDVRGELGQSDERDERPATSAGSSMSSGIA